jgi:hypothetical protein
MNVKDRRILSTCGGGRGGANDHYIFYFIFFVQFRFKFLQQISTKLYNYLKVSLDLARQKLLSAFCVEVVHFGEFGYAVCLKCCCVFVTSVEISRKKSHVSLNVVNKTAFMRVPHEIVEKKKRLPTVSVLRHGVDHLQFFNSYNK